MFNERVRTGQISLAMQSLGRPDVILAVLTGNVLSDPERIPSVCFEENSPGFSSYDEEVEDSIV
jgi:hypothetical protein